MKGSCLIEPWKQPLYWHRAPAGPTSFSSSPSKHRKSQVTPSAFRNLPLPERAGFFPSVSTAIHTDLPTFTGATLANLQKAYHSQDTKGWATQRATGCKTQGPGTHSPIPKGTTDPRIPAERDKKAEMMAGIAICPSQCLRSTGEEQ